jgi:hypothetical protein
MPQVFEHVDHEPSVHWHQLEQDFDNGGFEAESQKVSFPPLQEAVRS